MPSQAGDTFTTHELISTDNFTSHIILLYMRHIYFDRHKSEQLHEV
jgi:hypothetical protein